MNATELRAALSLASIYVMRMLGLFMVMPVLAILAVDYPDFSAWHVGVAIGGYGLTQAILQIPFGMLSDKIGRKPVILIGLIFFALGSFIAGYADSMTWVIIGRVLQGAGAIAGAVMALAADVTRETQRTKVMAIIGIAIGFSFYLALLLGPVLARDYGLSGLFFITGGFSIAGMFLVLFVVPNAQNIAPSADTLPRAEQVKRLLLHPQLKILNLSVCFLHLFITVLFVQLPGILVAQGIALDAQWEVYLPVLLVSILGLMVFMRIAQKRAKIVLIMSIATLMVCFNGLLAYSLSDDFALWRIYLMVIVFFIGFNYLEANIPALVSAIAPAGKKGTAMGIYASFQFFGAFLGGIISGLAIDSFSPTVLYTVCIAIGVFWLILIGNLRSHQRVKRVTLALDLQKWSVSELAEKLNAVTGVQDITIVENENAAYLKVDAKAFALDQAKAAIQ
ncbi:MFS transporter [Opacimonas viscosa]|uniref:MFS transporter n=1 Tax=Opacimonas viscosa TaxID=2961944 RepID=A0AA42BM47_9ALTE|nr:MFS transporter [Opacimonas viscosa]